MGTTFGDRMTAHGAALQAVLQGLGDDPARPVTAGELAVVVAVAVDMVQGAQALAAQAEAMQRHPLVGPMLRQFGG